MEMPRRYQRRHAARPDSPHPQHPDGFHGEVVTVRERPKPPASFDGIHNDSNFSEYKPFPELQGKCMVNAEQQDLLTIDYLTRTIFAGKPVSSFLMDPYTDVWIGPDDHQTNGYRRVGEPGTMCVSYPCFTTARGNRIELKPGRWTGSGYAQNLKLIHCAVLKDHSGAIGMTGALKIVYGTLSMKDGTSAKRHYLDLGSQCAKMWTQVRVPDLNILDCIWVSYGSMTVGNARVSGCIGYPPDPPAVRTSCSPVTIPSPSITTPTATSCSAPAAAAPPPMTPTTIRASLPSTARLRTPSTTRAASAATKSKPARPAFA